MLFILVGIFEIGLG